MDQGNCSSVTLKHSGCPFVGGGAHKRGEMDTCRYLLVLIIAIFWPIAASALTAQSIDSAKPFQAASSPKKADPLIVKVEILLDRKHFSPGEIDGKPGENLNKALAAFASAQGLQWSGQWSNELWQTISADSPNQLVVQYTITADDLRGPFLAKLPTKMESMKHLRALSYTSPLEELAERFHMSEELLKHLNPKASFKKVGETIVVANVTDNPLPAKIARIEIDKTAGTLRAFDEGNNLIAFYPATVGSEEKPAPNGTLRVTAVQHNPTYHYNPQYAFKGVKTRHPFKIRPGPNNPVGVVWIGLSLRGYGIHGTPDPSKVSKTASHGCVRLTNWDALQLAAAVRKGTTVEFIGDEISSDAKLANDRSRPPKGRR